MRKNLKSENEVITKHLLCANSFSKSFQWVRSFNVQSFGVGAVAIPILRKRKLRLIPNYHNKHCHVTSYL